MKYGFVKVASITPQTKTLDIKNNAKIIIDKIIKAHSLGVQIACFPELCITGYSIGDMGFMPLILNNAEEALKDITLATKQRDILCFVGLPICVDFKIYNTMAVILNGEILGIIPKQVLTVEESKIFCVPNSIKYEEILISGFSVPINPNMMFKDFASKLVVGLSLGTDKLIDNISNEGANIVVCPFTKPHLINSQNENLHHLTTISKQNSCGVIYVGSNLKESASKYFFDKSKFILECGEVLAKDCSKSCEFVISDIDIEKINYRKSKNNIVKESGKQTETTLVDFSLKSDNEVLDRKFERFPYVPKTKEQFDNIICILSGALHRRIEHIDCKTMVVGVSGGLDSLATLLICDAICTEYDFLRENVICVTMPSSVSSARTKHNAEQIIKLFNFTHKNIPITQAILTHLADIGHNNSEDVTYENAQARERTQILMDIANMTGGIMLGTSDLSEEALGFSTFGGDATSMFQTISALAKTTLRALVTYVANTSNDDDLKDVLLSIVSTPISPELKSGQQTENIIGNYELHDFFLHNMIANGYCPEKLLFLATKAFDEISLSEIKKTLKIFLNRFFVSQFKRNAVSDGVQVFEEFLAPFAFNFNSDIKSIDFLLN